MMKTLAALAAVWTAVASAAAVTPTPVRASYDGHRVFRVPVGARAQHIRDVADRLGLGVWQAPSARDGSFADLEVPPAQLEAFEREMEGFELATMHDDLGRSIADEAVYEIYAEGSANDTWFKSYHAYDDHLRWLQALQERHPNNSEIVTSGTSNEGNTITGIHLFGNDGKGAKPAIVFHGTVHAREWIASKVVEFFAYSLLSGYDGDAEIRAFVDKYDFYLFPIVNPDGFKYTQTTDRMWRKNRQQTSEGDCVGRDINRNWPYQWDGPGSSTNPCAEDYRGESGGDSPENKALVAFMAQVKQAQGLKLYIDWHSYSQLFMTPYGFTCDALPQNNDELQALAGGTAEAIRAVHGQTFNHGPICSTIYQTSGNSVDWAVDVGGATYAFAAELRDSGRYGFVLPPNQIVPSSEEAFAGVKYLLQNMK